MLVVQIESEVRTQLRASVAAPRQREFIGALGGVRSGDALVVQRVAALPNLATTADRFEVDALAFAAAEHHLRQGGHPWLGFVHSHPHGDARASASDRHQLWRDCVQVIVAGDRRGSLVWRAFWLDAAGCHALRLASPDQVTV